MRISESKLRSIIRKVLIESYDEDNNFFDSSINFNTLSLTEDEAGLLLIGKNCCEEIKKLYYKKNNSVIVTDDQFRLNYEVRGYGSKQQMLIIVEYVNENWRLLWRPVENHIGNYMSEVRKYMGGKIIYAGCEINREKVEKFIKDSGYKYSSRK